MTIKQEIHRMSVRSSLNLIYTMSRTIATMMTMDEAVAAEIVQASSETILREAIELYDRIRTATEAANENT